MSTPGKGQAGAELAPGARATVDLGLLGEQAGDSGDGGVGGDVRGPSDPALGKLTLTPDKKTYQVGETFTASMEATNTYMPDEWALEGTFPTGLSVLGVTGAVTTATGAGTWKATGEGRLGSGTQERKTVTVTFRADKATAGAMTFTILNATRPDHDSGNNVVRRDISVLDKPAPRPRPAAGNLADTGASPAVPLYAGGVLVLLGGGLLVAVRRRRSGN